VSILDLVNSVTERHSEVNEQQHASLVQNAIQMFGHGGGISDLVKNAESHGIGGIVRSWIGTGANQTIAPGQLQGIVGQDRINQLASRVGISPNVASAALASILPVIVDKVTPHGKVPESTSAA